jgi:hypothetical protein
MTTITGGLGFAACAAHWDRCLQWEGRICFSSADTLASAENFMHTAGIARCCWSGRGIRNGVQIVRTVWFSTGPAGTPFREQ